MAKNQKRTSSLRRRGGNKTETKSDALMRGRRVASFIPMPRLVVARTNGRGQATVEVVDTSGRCAIDGTSLVFSDPDMAMAFLGI